MGVEDLVLDARSLSDEEIIEGCLERFENRKAYARRLAETIPEAKERLRVCFREGVLARPGGKDEG